MANRKLKTWAEVKAHRPLSTAAETANAAWVEQQVVELNLQALRQQLGVTQAELAEASGFAQGEISRIEQREDHIVSTLRRLVRSLGGELEIYARYPRWSRHPADRRLVAPPATARSGVLWRQI